MRVVTETEFAAKLREVLLDVEAGCVTGPGRSGAIAAAYASHFLGIPFLPIGVPVPMLLNPILLIDTARDSGRTLKRASRFYDEPVVRWVFDEPPRVSFWYERKQTLGHASARCLQRWGAKLSERDELLMLRRIVAGDAILIRERRGRKNEVWAVECDRARAIVPVVVSVERDAIITVLPREAAEFQRWLAKREAA